MCLAVKDSDYSALSHIVASQGQINMLLRSGNKKLLVGSLFVSDFSSSKKKFKAAIKSLSIGLHHLFIYLP